MIVCASLCRHVFIHFFFLGLLITVPVGLKLSSREGVVLLLLLKVFFVVIVILILKSDQKKDNSEQAWHNTIVLLWQSMKTLKRLTTTNTMLYNSVTLRQYHKLIIYQIKLVKKKVYESPWMLVALFNFHIFHIYFYAICV